MRENINAFRNKHDDTARVVLFDLVAVSASAFLLWLARNASATNKALTAVCGLTLIGITHKTANYFSTPSAQPVKNDMDSQSSENSKDFLPPASSRVERTASKEAVNDDKDSHPSEDPNALVRPATP